MSVHDRRSEKSDSPSAIARRAEAASSALNSIESPSGWVRDAEGGCDGAVAGSPVAVGTAVASNDAKAARSSASRCAAMSKSEAMQR